MNTELNVLIVLRGASTPKSDCCQEKIEVGRSRGMLPGKFSNFETLQTLYSSDNLQRLHTWWGIFATLWWDYEDISRTPTWSSTGCINPFNSYSRWMCSPALLTCRLNKKFPSSGGRLISYFKIFIIIPIINIRTYKYLNDPLVLYTLPYPGSPQWAIDDEMLTPLLLWV